MTSRGRYSLGSQTMMALQEAFASYGIDSFQAGAIFILRDGRSVRRASLARVTDRVVMPPRFRNGYAAMIEGASIILRDPVSGDFFEPHVPLVGDGYYLVIVPDDQTADDYAVDVNDFRVSSKDVAEIRPHVDRLTDRTQMEQTRPRLSTYSAVESSSSPFIQRTVYSEHGARGFCAIRVILSDDGETVTDMQPQPTEATYSDLHSAQLTDAQIVRAENALLRHPVSR